MKINWEDPPEKRQEKELLPKELLDALKRNPGKWAVVREARPTIVGTFAGRCRKKYLDYDFKSYTANGSGKVYGRYVGGFED